MVQSRITALSLIFTIVAKKKIDKRLNVCRLLVPVIGVEPIRYHYHRILSPARLPIPPHRQFTIRL